LRRGHGSRLKVWIGDRAIGIWQCVFWRRGGRVGLRQRSSGRRRRRRRRRNSSSSRRGRGGRGSRGGSWVGKVLRSRRRSRGLDSILVLHELEKVKTR